MAPLPPLERSRLLEEVRGHLEDATRDFEAAGKSGYEAQRAAIDAFGSPMAVAKQAAVWQSVVAGRQALRGTVIANMGPAVALSIFGVATGLAGSRVVQRLAGVFFVVFGWTVVAIYARLTRANAVRGTTPEESLLRQAHARQRMARTLWYQLAALGLTVAVGAPFWYQAHHSFYERNPINFPLGIGIFAILWLGMGGLVARINRKVNAAAEVLRH